MALGVIRTVGEWLPRAVGGRHGPRGALADAHGVAPRGRRPGERDRRRAGPRARPRDRDARQGRPRDRARRGAARRSSRFYLGTRDRELALVGIALGVASAAESEATAAASPSAPSTLLRDSTSARRSALGSRTTPRSTSSSPTLDDAAIRNSRGCRPLEARRSWPQSRDRRSRCAIRRLGPRRCLMHGGIETGTVPRRCGTATHRRRYARCATSISEARAEACASLAGAPGCSTAPERLSPRRPAA